MKSWASLIAVSVLFLFIIVVTAVNQVGDQSVNPIFRQQQKQKKYLIIKSGLSKAPKTIWIK